MGHLRRVLFGAALLLLALEWGDRLEPAQAAPREPAAWHKVRVTDDALARRIANRGGRLLADYGDAQLFAIDAALLPELESAARATAVAGAVPVIETRDDDDRILLHADTIDTSRADLQAARSRAPLAMGGGGGKRLHLIQFVGPVLPQWYEELARTGVRIVSYIPSGAYLVYGEEGAVGRVRAMQTRPYVQWDGGFLGEHKVHRAARRRGEGLLRDAADLFAIQMVADAEANAVTEALIDSLKQGPVRQRYSLLGYVTVVAPLRPSDVDVVAAQPEVVSIQPYVVPRKRDERQDQIVAGNLTGGIPTGPGYLAFLAGLGFSQDQFTTSGFAVDISDSGIDDGTTSPNHFGLYALGNLAGTSRVAYNRVEGTPNSGSTLQGCDGHGTINAHIVGGYVDATGFPFSDAAGFRYGLGVAPFVRVGSSVIFDPDTYTFPNFANLQSRAYRDGARISSNSWGAGSAIFQGAYNADAQAYDALVRDAQPAGSAVPVAGNQEMVIVFAAGNAGSGAGTVTPPGTAKNVITAGASENVHPFGGSDGCGIGDGGANSAEDIIYFSGRGPADDGRMKPDLVAPGTHVSGGVIQSTTPGPTGQAGACFNGSGVCGGVASPFFPAGQQFYTASSGTSHSTPAVAGGAALVRQHFINHGLAPPSPAMTKAVLMAAARYMTGVSANDTLWSPNQGMGMMDLGSAFDDAQRILRDQRAEDTFTATGQTRSFTGSISDGARPFRVTLAWTDAPGSTVGAAYKNNLDLEVTVGTTVYRGNVFSGAVSAAGGTADSRNNVESVFLPAGQAGTFAVTVRAANINSDGVPNSGGPLDQDFALVVYNGVEETLPQVVPAGTTLLGEGCGLGNGAVDPGERVTVSFGLANVGTAQTTNLMATLLETGGVTLPTGPQSYAVLLAGGPAASRPFSFTASGAEACGGQLTATLALSDGGADLGQATFELRLGTQVPGTPAAFSSAASISIPSVAGPASPYPSTINVSGLTGGVFKVTATVTGLSHTYPDDIDILLVGPQGQKVVLMSDAGSGGDVSNLTLTFDDAAAEALLDGGPLVSGTFRPSNYEGTDTFSSPAPGAPYEAAMSAFGGTDPNGAWRLFVMDDFTGDGGSMTGWSLNITTATPTCCGGGAGSVVTPTSGLVTTEAGGTATFTVALTSTPTANVSVALSSSDPTEGTVSPPSLTFTPANALTPQTVTVTGADDLVSDGSVAYTVVTAPATSADPAYDALDPADVTLTNTDDDLPGILVSPTSGLVTTEAGGTASFTVVLTSVPTADVTISLSSSDTTEGTVAPSSITFTPANALTPRTVVVTGVDDSLVDGNVPYTAVTGPAVSADPLYAGLNAPDVSATNRDNDTAAPSLGVTPTTVDPGGPVQVTVANGPGNVTDWVGLFAVGAPNNVYRDWKYLSDSRTAPATGLRSATLHFNMPTALGTYEFRFFASNGYTLLATSPVVTVVGGGGSPSLGVTPTTVDPGGPAQVTVANGPGNVTDWVGLFAVGAPNNPSRDWKYLSDSRTAPATGLRSATLHFNMPTALGTYEFRFFASNGYTLLATSPVVTVR